MFFRKKMVSFEGEKENRIQFLKKILKVRIYD